MERRGCRPVERDVQAAISDDDLERQLDELIHQFETLDLHERVLTEREKESIRRDITAQLATLLDRYHGRSA